MSVYVAKLTQSTEFSMPI